MDGLVVLINGTCCIEMTGNNRMIVYETLIIQLVQDGLNHVFRIRFIQSPALNRQCQIIAAMIDITVRDTVNKVIDG